MALAELTSAMIGSAIVVKLGGWQVGLLINFNTPLLKDGIRRRVLSLDE